MTSSGVQIRLGGIQVPWKGSWGHHAWPESMWKAPDSSPGVKWGACGACLPQGAQGESRSRGSGGRPRQVPQRWDELDSLVFPPLAHPPTVPATGCTATPSAFPWHLGVPVRAVLWLGRPLILHSQQALGESSSPHPEHSEIWG